MKRIFKLLTALTLIICLSAPLTAYASRKDPPTSKWDFDSDGSLYNDAFGGYGYSCDYTYFQFSPIGNGTTIPIRIEAGTFGAKKNTLRVSCIDATTNKTVASQIISATEHQYITFKNLEQYHYYYFQFIGYDVPGMIYISKDGLFPF